MKKLLFASFVLGASSVMLAVPITGVANTSGSASVSATTIDFLATAPGSPAGVCTSSIGLTAVGCYNENFPSNGSFGNIPLGQIGGIIKDLTGPPITGPIFLSQFMDFTNDVFFDLTFVVAGGQPPCVLANGNNPNYTCTPIINGLVSPFTLTNDSNGQNASVFFNVLLNGYTGTVASGVSQYAGGFTTQSAGTNIAGILNTIAAGGAVTASYSATFTGVVPEPGSMALLGGGLLALGLAARKRRKL